MRTHAECNVVTWTFSSVAKSFWRINGKIIRSDCRMRDFTLLMCDDFISYHEHITNFNSVGELRVSRSVE